MSANVTFWKYFSSLHFLAGKVREKCIVWCFRTTLNTVYRKLRSSAGLLIRRISWIIPSLRFMLRPGAPSEKRIMAIWDFRTVPYSIGDLIALHEALTLLEQEDCRKATLVKLKLFAGLTIPACAATLGIAVSTAIADWAYAKNWLRIKIGDLD